MILHNYNRHRVLQRPMEVAFEYIHVMRFKKPWLRVESVNFDFSSKYQVLIITNRISQSRSASLYRVWEISCWTWSSKKWAFSLSHFLLYWKVYFSPWAMGSVKSSSTDYNESNEPNPKSLAHIRSEKSLVELGVPKNKLSYFFFTFFALLKRLLFHPEPWFPKIHYTYRPMDRNRYTFTIMHIVTTLLFSFSENNRFFFDRGILISDIRLLSF